MISGSTPFSLAMASICWSSGFVVAMYQSRNRLSLAHRLQLPASSRLRTHAAAASLSQNSTSSRPRLISASGTRCTFRPSSSSTTPSSTPREPAGKRGLALDRRARHDLGEPAGEAPIVRLVPQGPIEPRRRNLQRVRLAERRLAQFVLLDVEQRAQVLADALTARAMPTASSSGRARTALPGSGRSMTTRNTMPTGSRRSCTSNISSP